MDDTAFVTSDWPPGSVIDSVLPSGSVNSTCCADGSVRSGWLGMMVNATFADVPSNAYAPDSPEMPGGPGGQIVMTAPLYAHSPFRPDWTALMR